MTSKQGNLQYYLILHKSNSPSLPSEYIVAKEKRTTTTATNLVNSYYFFFKIIATNINFRAFLKKKLRQVLMTTF